MSGDSRPADRRRDRHLAAVDADAPRVAQSGDRVVVTEGDFEGRVGLVVSIHLVPDEDTHRREAMVVLDTAGGGGGRLHRLADGLLRVLDHPTTEET